MTDIVEVKYAEERWKLLEALRFEASNLMKPLVDYSIEPLAYGSVARGDVKAGSDIDIFISRPPAPTILEAIIEDAGFNLSIRELVQATPTYAAKGYVYIGENRSYSFPLIALRRVEREFYSFAGSVTYDQLEKSVRVSGVDKRLHLIIPTKEGHTESPVQGMEGTVAKTLGVSVYVVLDRIRALHRREKVGRTGLYLKRTLAPEETFGDVFMTLARRRPALRRRLRR